MSAAPIRLLHLEDDALDAALVRETLRADGFVCEIDVVASREAFEAALARGGYAVVLADYSLPGFDGLTAQRIAETRAPDVPFIFVSGTLGEEIAVERIKAGATDYVLKQRIARLGSAVRRAIAEAAERRQRLDAQAALRRLNAELEARVERRTEQLEAANARLAGRERALADSEARLAAILENSPTAIYVKDLDGRYILFNKQLEAALPAPLALGDRADGILPPHVVSALRRNDQEVVARNTAMQFEEIVPGPKGPRVYMSSKFPLRGADGVVYAVCGISVDITHRKEHEEELKLARLEAERANQAKSEFLSRMSHDLRTPLNAVLGFAQLLDLDALRPDQSDSVRQILKGGRHLLELINEILEIARIESGHLALSLEPVNVAESIDQSLGLVAPLAAARAIEIHADAVAPDRFVAADRHRLAQVLLNLLSNAVKYNHPGGRVAIHVDDERDARTRIAIADTGPGIPLTKRHLLFQPFERLGAEHTAVEGTGLGLTVARRLTERMGGELDFRSDDTGSTFWIELPSCAAPQEVTAPAAADPLPAPPPASRGTVLYVEDNLSNVRLLERVLARRPGVQLAHTAIGREAVDLAVRLAPSLVLLDMHLSDTTGDAVFDELRRRPETRHIPVVVLSADAMPDHVARLNAAGILAYLTKPINVAEVLRLVDRTLV